MKKNKNKLILPFLGNREYLHGTTMLKSLLELIPKKTTFCLRIMKIIKSNVIEIKNCKTDSIINARMDWEKDNQKGSLFITESNPILPVRKEIYDEELILEKVNFKNSEGFISYKKNFNLISLIIPIFKKLLSVYSKNSKKRGQWMFSRLDSYFFFDSKDADIKVELKYVKVDYISMANIFIDESYWGDIYFSWVLNNE